MFKQKFLFLLSFLLIFSTVGPSYGAVLASAQNENEEIIDLTQFEQLDDQEVIKLSEDIEVVETSNNHVSEITVNIDSDDLKVESELTTNLETEKFSMQEKFKKVMKVSL